MSWQIVNSVETLPFKCEMCNASLAPFSKSDNFRPAGGNFHLCWACVGPLLAAWRVVSFDDHQVLKEQLATAKAEAEGLRVQLADRDQVQAALTNAEAELAGERANGSVMASLAASLERDLQAARDGQKLLPSELPAAIEAGREEVFAEVAEASKKPAARKPKEPAGA